MKAKNNSMAGGIIMLFSLVVLLSVPMVVGHYALKPSAKPSLQASVFHAR